MFTSLHGYEFPCAFCTIHDRGDVWPARPGASRYPARFRQPGRGACCRAVALPPTGWRAVETLEPGDMVLTFDNGMRRLTRALPRRVGPDPRTGHMRPGAACAQSRHRQPPRHHVAARPARAAGLRLRGCPLWRSVHAGASRLPGRLQGHPARGTWHRERPATCWPSPAKRSSTDGSALLACHATGRKRAAMPPASLPAPDLDPGRHSATGSARGTMACTPGAPAPWPGCMTRTPIADKTRPAIAVSARKRHKPRSVNHV